MAVPENNFKDALQRVLTSFRAQMTMQELRYVDKSPHRAIPHRCRFQRMDIVF